MGETKGHKRLRRFLDKTELTAAQLAKLAGLSQMQVSHLICGRRKASLGVAVALERATHNAIPVGSWLK